MTTAKNEDLQALVSPKKKDDEIRPQGPVHHESVPVDTSGGVVDSSGGTTQPDGPVHHESEPMKLRGGTTQPDGPVHHESEPAKSS